MVYYKLDMCDCLIHTSINMIYIIGLITKNYNIHFVVDIHSVNQANWPFFLEVIF